MKSDEKAKMRNQEKQEKYLFIKDNITGITLVALVVTIVVLLILAGITLNYLFGDNSILDKASEARLKTDVASWKEKLEIAKGPNIIQGLGTFDPDKYFEYIEEQGIINDKNADVLDNGDGTYEVTVVPGYVFEIELMPTKDNPSDAKIEYIGEKGKLQPKIKRIVVTGRTKTSFDIKILARLEGGEISCYYKKSSDVMEGEAEDDTAGYTPVILNENLEGSITELAAGEIYKIKAVMRKEGQDIQWISVQEKTVPMIAVLNIIIDKKTATIAEDEILQLNATVEPDNAEDKTVTWSSSNNSIATVDQTGKVTGIAVGTATITVTANDGSGISASCKVDVVDLWEKINRIAKAIAKDDEITNTSTSAVGTTENNEEYNIKIGDIFYVKYNGERRRVRVLGFKHDELVDTGVYGSTHSKASISFEFLDCITADRMKMNSSDTNSTGWGGCKLRTDLNGSQSTIDGLGKNFSNSKYIKKVTKTYLLGNNRTTIKKSQDWLWLLAYSEIWSTLGENLMPVPDSQQYTFYKEKIGTASSNSVQSVAYKFYPGTNNATDVWTRSPISRGEDQYFLVYSPAGLGLAKGNGQQSVCPGFCI